jgi:hypothetical protein
VLVLSSSWRPSARLSARLFAPYLARSLTCTARFLAAYLPILPMFKKLLPGIRPVTLSASIIFSLPVLRDVLEFVGLREITRQTFVRTLEQRNAILIVPGGQAELVLTSRFTTQREAAFYARHKGFIRLSLQQGASVVPILVFGEVTSLRNFVDTPRIHRWTYRMLSFPLPYLIGGKWKILPFPSREGLKFVIGKPIEPPASCRPGLVPTEDQVESYHRLFYETSKDLWNKHRKTFPGYEDMEAVLVM